MRIGVPKEIKRDEHRVGLRPVGVEVLKASGHDVMIERGAGVGSGLTDELYQAAGATIIDDPDTLWAQSEMIIKVKEPQAIEYPRMRSGQVVFTYFHFAADRELTLAALERGVTAVAYETLTAPGPNGTVTLPLLTPMSEIAGRMATQEGAKYLEKPFGGAGVLLGGVPGVEPGNVLVIGGGVVGYNAATIAYGMGAHVAVMDIDIDQMRRLGSVMPRQLITVYSDPEAVREYLAWADLVIGAVLVAGAKAPRLITREHLALMKPGSVIVDVAIDQGGCAETSRVTTHTDPVYEVDGVMHYCVGNMPGAVARTSTWALTNATLPWAERIATRGWETLADRDEHFRAAVNTHAGKLLNEPVARAHGLNVG
ncbi:MAG: alanine dehydrogenase [Phycisphaerae bacterium]|nr:alanine dehydrogenase [Phycisphaerae bacterium]